MRKCKKPAYSLTDEPFFQGISEEALHRLEPFVRYREYEARQVVFFPGDPCDTVFWVRSGRIKVTRVSRDGRKLTFRHLLPGDMLGEECLLNPCARKDYAEAMGPALLCLMSSEDFLRMMKQEVEVVGAVARALCRRVFEVEQVLADTVFSTVRRRIASGLLRLYHNASPNADEPSNESAVLRVTHEEIANLVGSTRETTTAVLHDLRAEGIIHIANRRIMLLDPAALERLSIEG